MNNAEKSNDEILLDVTSFYIGDVTKRLKDVKIEIINPIRVKDDRIDYASFYLHMSRGANKSVKFMIMDYDRFKNNTKVEIIKRLQSMIDTDIIFINDKVKWSQKDLTDHIIKELEYKPNTEEYDFVVNRGAKRDYEIYKFFTDVLDVEEIIYLKDWEIYDGIKKYWYQ